MAKGVFETQVKNTKKEIKSKNLYKYAHSFSQQIGKTFGIALSVFSLTGRYFRIPVKEEGNRANVEMPDMERTERARVRSVLQKPKVGSWGLNQL